MGQLVSASGQGMELGGQPLAPHPLQDPAASINSKHESRTFNRGLWGGVGSYVRPVGSVPALARRQGRGGLPWPRPSSQGPSNYSHWYGQGFGGGCCCHWYGQGFGGVAAVIGMVRVWGGLLLEAVSACLQCTSASFPGKSGSLAEHAGAPFRPWPWCGAVKA